LPSCNSPSLTSRPITAGSTTPSIRYGKELPPVRSGSVTGGGVGSCEGVDGSVGGATGNGGNAAIGVGGCNVVDVEGAGVEGAGVMAVVGVAVAGLGSLLGGGGAATLG
jgi:hypothetical protein